jgi:DNA helicase-2/ATP-dependent DNA helicase PcrA
MLKDSKPKANAKVEYSGYKPGVKVRHTKFGEGMVITVKGSGDNMIVDVAFMGVGVKSLSAKYAPMEIIK